MAARFLPVQHPDSLASRPVWGDSSTPSRHACMGRGCDSSFCCRLGHRHSHASARDGIRKRSSESQGATGIALPLKAAQVFKRSFAASHPGHGTGCYRSAAITPRSASQDRYAVHSCQSTSSDRRRPFVSTGLGHPKALVGQELTVTVVCFGAGCLGPVTGGTGQELPLTNDGFEARGRVEYDPRRVHHWSDDGARILALGATSRLHPWAACIRTLRRPVVRRCASHPVVDFLRGGRNRFRRMARRSTIPNRQGTVGRPEEVEQF